MKLIIVHPGIQHAPRLANAAVNSRLFTRVSLLTSILFKNSNYTPRLFKKRQKKINPSVNIINHYIYTCCYELSKIIYNKIVHSPGTQAHNNPIYFWQQVFGYICLPRLWLNRKQSLVICFETAGHPIAKFCKKWKIPVIMDFASISHEKAKELGINETEYGIRLKLKERQYIDFAFFCSHFCEESFKGKTSSQKNFILYLGAEEVESSKLRVESKVYQESSVKNQDTNRSTEKDKIVKISFIANLEYRKGLDILLEALLIYDNPKVLTVYLIGRIRKEWVNSYLNGRVLPINIILIYKEAMDQTTLFTYLIKEKIALNILPSRFDSFGMVVPETMMLGIPNVLSPFVGAGEMLNHLHNGYRLPELSPQSILEAISWFLVLNEIEHQKLRENIFDQSKLMSWDSYNINITNTFTEILKALKK